MAYVVDETGNPINRSNRFPVDNSTGEGFVAITPSDTDDLTSGATKGLYVGVAGTIKIKLKDGSIAALPTLVAGVVHPISITRVYATDTTATSVFGVY